MNNKTLEPKIGGEKARTLYIGKLVPKNKRYNLGLKNLGQNGKNYPRICPSPVRKEREKVLTDHYGAIITIGADDEYSKLGGRCTEIDMMVGPVSSITQAATDPERYTLKSPDFDAARIRISETTNPDEVVGALKGPGDADARSAILLVADAIRVKSKEGIKLITSSYGNYNSKSGKVICPSPIELIAGNDSSDMQPIVKGNNLVKALDNMNERIDKLFSIIQTLSEAQAQFTTSLAAHIHVGATGPVAPSVELAPFAIKAIKAFAEAGLAGALTGRINAIIEEFNSLTPIGSNSIQGQNRTN